MSATGRRSSADERRRHKRFDVSCVATVQVESCESEPRGRVVNISNGGVLLDLANGEIEDTRLPMNVRILLPRSTANSFMIEEVCAAGEFVRMDAPHGKGPRIALRFNPPLDLGMDV